MAKYRKKIVKKSLFDWIARTMFTLSLVTLLFSSLVFNTWDTSMTMELQNMNDQIASLKDENEKLEIEISSLQNKDRVYVIAEDAGLDQIQDNIIAIKGEN